MKKAKVLFVSQDITPYLDETFVGKIARKLPQGIQERGKEIRTFMPRYGNINERRHQLHELKLLVSHQRGCKFILLIMKSILFVKPH